MSPVVSAQYAPPAHQKELPPTQRMAVTQRGWGDQPAAEKRKFSVFPPNDNKCLKGIIWQILLLNTTRPEAAWKKTNSFHGRKSSGQFVTRIQKDLNNRATDIRFWLVEDTARKAGQRAFLWTDRCWSYCYRAKVGRIAFRVKIWASPEEWLDSSSS